VLFWSSPRGRVHTGCAAFSRPPCTAAEQRNLNRTAQFLSSAVDSNIFGDQIPPKMSRRARKQEVEDEMEVDETEEAKDEDAVEAEDAEDALPDGENAENQPPSSQQQSYRPQETRLIINKMVLENFKSYAGKQEIGPLHHCFSAVVGPNGSGKSNVIDAVLFVFGRQAKKLRLNKVSEFIHNSEHQRNLTSAKVSVHFEEIYVVVRP
jgi:ATPase subunit of ABC transporter with duplicated ATPase domains